MSVRPMSRRGRGSGGSTQKTKKEGGAAVAAGAATTASSSSSSTRPKIVPGQTLLKPLNYSTNTHAAGLDEEWNHPGNGNSSSGGLVPRFHDNVDYSFDSNNQRNHHKNHNHGNYRTQSDPTLHPPSANLFQVPSLAHSNAPTAASSVDISSTARPSASRSRPHPRVAWGRPPGRHAPRWPAPGRRPTRPRRAAVQPGSCVAFAVGRGAT